MRLSQVRNERGMALVLAVFSLVVIGALVAGSFFVGRLEQLTGYSTAWAAQAGEAAEAGLTSAMAIDRTVYEAIPIWTAAAPNEYVVPTTTVTGAPGRVYVDSIRRLNDQVFLIRSTGQLMGSGGRVLAKQTLSQMMRLARPNIGVSAAITVQDPINFNGNALNVTGYNSYPFGWGASDCPVGAPDPLNTDDVVGIRSASTTGATDKDLTHMTGYPTTIVEHDPTITSSTFQNFLDYTYQTLSSQTGVKVLDLDTPYNGVGPVVDYTAVPAECDKTAPFNFGEPTRDPGALVECENYFPVVHGTATRTYFAAGARGQGILLVDGDLELVGGFEWSGLIIVRGKMKVTGTGNKISGAVLTEGVNLDEAGTIGGDADIRFSRCAIERAMTGAATPHPVSRGWSQLY